MEKMENQVKNNDDDIVVIGDSTVWRTIVKVYEEDEWCDTTMAMQLKNGVLVRTLYNDDEGSSQAMQFIPDAVLETDNEGRTYIK